MSENPCPSCHASRETLEADCRQCGWSPNAIRDQRCQCCLADETTAPVTLQYNIGLIFFRMHGSLERLACRSCAGKCFMLYSLITLLFGWWGVISFFATPIILAGNLGQAISHWNATRRADSSPQAARRTAQHAS